MIFHINQQVVDLWFSKRGEFKDPVAKQSGPRADFL